MNSPPKKTVKLSFLMAVQHIKILNQWNSNTECTVDTNIQINKDDISSFSLPESHEASNQSYKVQKMLLVFLHLPDHTYLKDIKNRKYYRQQIGSFFHKAWTFHSYIKG